MVLSLENINYPKWHFIGSKHSIWPWIREKTSFSFNSVVDLFGGTGIISHGFRLLDKEVYYNDFLKYLQISASGLLQSTKSDTITNEIINEVVKYLENQIEPSIFTERIGNRYFFPEESLWIDKMVQAIDKSNCSHVQKNILYFALFQSCLKKRPFHTFHGSFLNLRLKKHVEVQTWDLDMLSTFKQTIISVNTYLEQLPEKIQSVSVSNYLASQTKPEFFTDESIDLLYLDPPFISNKKKRTLRFANYIKNYFVLELLANYNNMNSLIDTKTDFILKKNYPPAEEMELWIDQNQKHWILSFEKIIKSFQDSKIVVSYRADSLISLDQIKSILESYKTVTIHQRPHVYEQQRKKSKFNDLLFIAS